MEVAHVSPAALPSAIGGCRPAQKRDWLADGASLPDFDKLHHLVFYPTYGESEDIVADALHYLTLQDVPLDRVSVVLAFEERDPMAHTRAQRLSERFAPVFQNLLITFHPDQDGEVRGKSANLTWAARRVQAQLIDPGYSIPTI